MKSNGKSRMKEAQTSEIEQTTEARRPRRRRKWWILPVAAMLAATIAAALHSRQQRLNEQMELDEQMRALAEEPGAYCEMGQGRRWYLKLAKKLKLPMRERPDCFGSSWELRDEDMAVVGRANRLRFVWLESSYITDAGMSHLEGLTRLEWLFLKDTKIGDAGLAHLSELTGLLQLRLSGTSVTDAGLAHLKSLKGLSELRLSATRVTPEGVADLKSALPEVKVRADFE